MSDLIDREKALDKIWEARRSQQMLDNTQVADLVMHGLYIAESIIEESPSVQPTHSTPFNALGALDCVSREDLTKEIEAYFGDLPIKVHYDMLALAQKLPSVQPAPCEFCKHNNIADDKACLMCSAERRTDESD